MATYEMLRPIMRAWYAITLFRDVVPKPRDEPWAHTGEPTADRVLLIGNGPCHGWGVVTHQLALTGQLSRALRRTTLRPGDVDYVGDEAMNMQSSVAWLGERDLGGYDVAVVVIGISDAVRLTPLPVWEASLRRLLDKLGSDLRQDARIVVAGMQNVRSVTSYNKLLGRVAELHRRRLNARTRAVVAEYERVDYFALTAPRTDSARDRGSADEYREWAELIAAEVAPALAVTSPVARPVTPEVTRDWEWSGGARAVELAALGGSAELQRLAALAEQQFGVDLAVITLLNGDRVWYAMHTEVLPAHIPMELSFCVYTAQSSAAMIVPDARRDERFSENPLIELSMMPFYAGYPLTSSTGEPIGSFCLHAAKPRARNSIPIADLRELALQAQTELWTYEQV